MNGKRWSVIIGVMVVCGLLTGTAAAQGGYRDTERTLHLLENVTVPIRDAVELAGRLGGVLTVGAIEVEPAPAFAVGDRRTFYVGNSETRTRFQVEAELAAASTGIYLWVEVGVDYDAEALDAIARTLDAQLFPSVRALFGQEPSPGIDGDPHIYVLNVTGIGVSIGGYFNDNSMYPRQVIDTSNEHEMFVIAVDNVPFDSDSYLYVLAHEFVHMIQHNEDLNEETWVIEGTAELGAFLTVQPQTFPIQTYLADPSVQLNAWDIDHSSPYYGGSALFFLYLVERFGPEIVLVHSREQTDGITGVNHALAAIGATDPVSGQPITFADVYADWLVANLVNTSILGDGRYAYSRINLQGMRAALTGAITRYPATVPERPVNQHGVEYIRLSSATDQTVTVRFTGSETVPVVPTDAPSGTHFYWANRTDQSNPRLTRAFDLSGVDSATLTFSSWFEMTAFWDYGYLSISTDGGETWQVLETPATTRDDPNSRAFAAGVTGASRGGTEPRPAPFMGINYDSSVGAITGLVPESGAAIAGLQPGDILVAIDTVPLDPADLVLRLNSYYVGDTAVFTVNRAGEQFQVPVTLGPHPDRVIQPQPDWIEESVDLTPYIGGEVRVRFEYVTDQAFTRNGWVIDDIRIPEIGYFDNAETATGGWESEGWVRIANQLPQEFLVEVVESSPSPNVRRLLMPGEGTSGQWTIPVGPDAPAVLIVSGMTQYTTQPASYSLMVDVVE